MGQPQQGRSRNPGATWGSCWPLPKQGNAWSHRDLFDAGNHFKGKEENLKHTITCQCTICNNNFQQAQSLDVRERSTARNKLAPRSQQDRLHPNEGTQKGQNRASGSAKSTPLKKAHCKK